MRQRRTWSQSPCIDCELPYKVAMARQSRCGVFRLEWNGSLTRIITDAADAKSMTEGIE